MWFSLEGFRASRRKQNHLKGLEEGASGGGKKNKKQKNQEPTSGPSQAPRGRGHSLPPQSGSTHFWRDRVAEAEPDLPGGVG